ncbi:hypothetical protein RUM44_001218 [Polyplax serrata]|uniref:Ig-like domain-containing protein n=1 Tax=Polyplax serrata TaxID=468196 RepID=A0ABR1B6T9_POLSC
MNLGRAPRLLLQMYNVSKNSNQVPQISLDARNEPLEHATHWAMSNEFGSRSNFLIGNDSTSSRLRISKVVQSDQGIYRCRIDYNNSPTKNYKVNLTLIVQPSEPIIYDAQGREVIGVAGPFMEGYDLFLSCHVVGGHPRPKVTWWSEDTLLDDVMESVGPTLTVNQYFRPNVSRTLYNSKLKCRVSVTETSPPLVKEVRVEVYLKPKFVKMNVMSTLLSSGRPQQYQCDTWGSVPPAKISWLLEGEPIRNAAVSVVIKETNQTSSVLTYKPMAEDDGKELTCRAENPRYLGSLLEESMELTVLYPPKVDIKLGAGIDPDMLREGDQVRFFCNVRSNPKPTQVLWFHGAF